MNAVDECDVTVICLRELQKRDVHLSAEGRTILFLDDRVAELEAKYETTGQKCNSGHVNNLPMKLWDCPMCTEKLREQRDALLTACKMALKRRPVPVGWLGIKESLEDAVAKAEKE